MEMRQWKHSAIIKSQNPVLFLHRDVFIKRNPVLWHIPNGQVKTCSMSAGLQYILLSHNETGMVRTQQH